MKLWILASSDSGFTYKSHVYTRKYLIQANNGLVYYVVMGLMDGHFGQGYHLAIIFIAVQNYLQTYFIGEVL